MNSLSACASIPLKIWGLCCSFTECKGIETCVLPFIDDKLMGLDEYYLYRRDENFRSSAMGVEERLLLYQRQLEEESRRQLKLEVRILDSEMSSSSSFIIIS